MTATIERIDRYTALGLCAIVLWSATIAFGRRASEAVGPLTAGATIYIAGGALLLLLDRLRKTFVEPKKRPSRRYLFVCGFLFALYSVALYLALGVSADRAQAIEVGLLNYLWPALTLVFSLVLLRHRAKIGFVPGTALALAGVFFVLTNGEMSWRDILSEMGTKNPLAYELGFLAAICWALYSNLTRRWAEPGTEKGAAPLFTLASGIAMLTMRLFHPEPGAFDLRVVIEIAFMAAATAFGYLFWEMAMQRGDVVLVAAFSYFTPLLSTLISCLYLHVLPGKGIWIGCALLVAGSFLSWKSIENAPENSEV